MDNFSTFLQNKITEVLEECLENMAFISLEPSSKDEVEEIGAQLLGVNLLITEPALFEMQLNASQELLYQIAENMYTMDRDDLSDDLINDLLAEILNTLAGRFMTEALPPETHYVLGLPELSTETATHSELTFYYLAEDCPLTVEIKAADVANFESIFSV
jgi:hypothetical protein